MNPQCRKREFSGEIRHPEKGYGAVIISHSDNDDGINKKLEEVPAGLIIYTQIAYKLARDPSHFAIHFVREHQELAVVAFQAAFGYMPIAVFADWLEEREDTLFPLVYAWPNEDTKAHWNGILSEMRRIGGAT